MIQLMPFGPADFDALISWVDSEETMVQFAGPIFSFPLTRQQLVAYLDEGNRHAFAVRNEEGRHIGHAEIMFRDDQTALFCRILIGDPAHRGQGLGGAVIRSLQDIAFRQLGATNVELNVYDWNIGAIRCYEREGFSINPDKVKTKEVKGQTWTALNMVLSREQYEAGAGLAR